MITRDKDAYAYTIYNNILKSTMLSLISWNWGNYKVYEIKRLNRKILRSNKSSERGG